LPDLKNENSQIILQDEIHNIVREFSQNFIKIPTLKLISVVTDLREEINALNSEFDNFLEIPSENAMGKTISWYSGDICYSIILLNDYLGLALTRKGTDEYILSKSALIHELAHIVDEVNFNKQFGLWSDLRDKRWGNIRKFIARSFWSEFFAEKTASLYNSDKHIKDTIFYSINCLIENSDIFFSELVHYKIYLSNNLLISRFIELHSVIFNQFGRAFGCLTSETGKKYRDEFFQRICNYSKEWNILLNRANQIFVFNSHKLISEFDYESLQKIIDDSFAMYDIDPNKY